MGYKKLVNEIKSLESLHKIEQDEFEKNIQQHELMRLKKIHSSEKTKCLDRLVEFIEKS